jgi:hypothetical protein
MISNSVKINNVTVEVNRSIVAEMNRKGAVGYGSFSVFSEVATRYEPYTIVDLICNSKTFQYVVQADEPHQEKTSFYEHVITLAEPILFFKTVFPTDRSFTKETPMTIAEIFAVYKRELSFYQGIGIDLENNTDAIYATKMPWKEYASKNFAVIIYDLFRRIDSIPRVEWDWASSTWIFSSELINAKGSLITVNQEAADTAVNDMDYATTIKGQARNALRENDPGIWFPSVDGWVSPRAKGTLFRDTELQYQFPHPIITIKQALYKMTVYVMLAGTSEWVQREITIDWSRAIKSKEEWEALTINGINPHPVLITHAGYPHGSSAIWTTPTPLYYKTNTVYYEIGNNTIDNLFSQEQYVFFTQNVTTLSHAITQFAIEAADEQYDLAWDESEFIPVYAEDATESELFPAVDAESIKSRFLFTTQRDFDFNTEKADISGLVRSTVLNAQSENMIDSARYIESANALANRLGHPIERREQLFRETETPWNLGDYSALGTIIDIRYAFDRYNTLVTADFAIGFSNTSGEYSISKEPEAFLIGKLRQHTNPIYSEYLVFSKTNRTDDTIFTNGAKDTMLNTLAWNIDNNEPINHANMIPYPTDISMVFSGSGIDMLVFGSGSGNVIMLNVAFNHQTIAGYGKVKDGTAWYKSPVKYVYTDEELEDAMILFQNGMTLLTDISTLEYYPLVSSLALLINAKTSRVNFPIDKNPNDSFGLTLQVICVSDTPDDIVIGNAFAKYNNLIYDISTEPDIRIYVSQVAFSVFDKRIRAGDTLDTGASAEFSSNRFDITLSVAYEDWNWAITYGEEIMLAGNNETYAIYMSIVKERP